MLRTLFTRLQYRTKAVNFPFNFDGVFVDEEVLRTRYVPMNQRCRQSISKIFEEDISEGFTFAFKNVLAALEQNDLAYLKQVCEPTLYQELDKSVGQLTGDNLYLKSECTDDADLNMNYTSLSFVYGVNHNRSSNLAKEDYEHTTLWNLKNGIDLQFYKTKTEPQASLPFMRVACLFSSPSRIYLKDKDGGVLRGETSTSYHKMIFEGVGDMALGPQFENAKEAQKNIWKVMSNAESEEKLQLIRRLFQVENITWKVVDIDNYMEGNPYAN